MWNEGSKRKGGGGTAHSNCQRETEIYASFKVSIVILEGIEKLRI